MLCQKQQQQQQQHWQQQQQHRRARTLRAAHLDVAPRWPVGAASGTKTKNVVLSVGQPWCQAEEGKSYSSGARVPRPPHLRKGGEGGPPRLQKGAAGGVEIQPQRGSSRCRIASEVMQFGFPRGAATGSVATEAAAAAAARSGS